MFLKNKISSPYARTTTKTLFKTNTSAKLKNFSYTHTHTQYEFKFICYNFHSLKKIVTVCLSQNKT